MRTRVEQICDGDGADCHDEPVDVDRWAPQGVTALEAAAPAACEGPRVPCRDSHGRQLPPTAARPHGEEGRRRTCESTWEFNGPAARVAFADLEPGVPGLLDHPSASEADRRPPSGKTELIRNRHTSRAYELFHHLPVCRPGTSRDRVATAPRTGMPTCSPCTLISLPDS